MKPQIQEVQKYYKNKILSQDYEILSITEYFTTILIDDKYHFVLWTAVLDHPESVKQYKHDRSFMQIDFTDAEARQLHAALYPQITKHKKGCILAEKIKELEKLKTELGEH